MRDPKVDYLIAYAVLGEVDYPITGDEDLASPEHLDTVRFLSPRQSWDLLKAQT